MKAAAVRAFFAAAAPADFEEAFNTPFEDAIRFHRQKINLPTRTWRDIEGRAHDRAFVVAGVTKEDMLADLNKEVDNAIAKGETLKDFQKRFDEIALKNGWLADKNAKVRAWRARIVYETNLRTANQAGRLKQLRDPAMMKQRPYWQYVHAETREPMKPRPMHLAWDGLILRGDDPWWDAHYPPNGWLCTCGVRALTAGDLKRAGKTVDQAPDDGSRFVLNSATGEFEDVPNGIDPGWDHAPGADWLAGLAPAPAKPEAPAVETKPAQTDAPIAPEPNQPLAPEDRPGFLDAVSAFFKAIIGKFRPADHAEGAAIEGGVFTDVLGQAVPLSIEMFQRGSALVGSQALADALPDIADAIRNPREIRLAWTGRDRARVTRIYVGDAAIVCWNARAWRVSQDLPAGAVVAWSRGDAADHAGFNPDEPRVPSGEADGGQWTDGDYHDMSGSSENEIARKEDEIYKKGAVDPDYREDRAVLGEYADDDHDEINKGLNSGAIDHRDRRVQAIDEAIGNWRTTSSLTVHRGLKPDVVAKLRELSPGDEYHEKNFASTSLVRKRAEGFGGVVTIRLPKGSHAYPMNGAGVARHSYERELLLPRNTKFVVVQNNADGLIVRAETPKGTPK
ncbi:MAG: phage minor head protein [Rhodoblastus sp.]